MSPAGPAPMTSTSTCDSGTVEGDDIFLRPTDHLDSREDTFLAFEWRGVLRDGSEMAVPWRRGVATIYCGLGPRRQMSSIQVELYKHGAAGHTPYVP